MQHPVIVLISGWSHAGKDSIAKILVETYEFQKLAFADPVKQIVAKEQEIPLEWCYDQQKKTEPLAKFPERTLREEIIRVGEGGRKEDPGRWARIIGEKIQKSFSRGKRDFVISDWRNLEELFSIQKCLPTAVIIPIRVVRPSQTVSPVPDFTEYSLLGFPFWRIIENKGTLHCLLKSITEFVEEDIPKLCKSK